MKTIAIFLLFAFFQVQLFARIIMSPYLQAVTESSVFVMVECDKPEAVTIFYGLTGEYGMTAKTEVIAMTKAKHPTYVHEIRISGLRPATKYYYHAAQGKSVSAGASFSTAVTRGTPFRMVWMADCRTGTDVFSTISGNMLASSPVMALYGGDLCHNSAYKSWKKEFFCYDQLIFSAQVPFFNTPGNHEGWKQNTKAFTRSPESDSHTEDYYSFDYGDIHVLCLNSLLPYDSGTPQYEFAKKDLAGSSQSWKIVMAHAPAYCGGGHGENAGLIAMTREIFEPNHVSLYLSGHSHFYQHNFVNGIHHMVIGAAGAPLCKPVRKDYTVSQVKDYNFAVIDVSPAKLKVVVFNAEMEVLDSLEIVK